MLHALTHSMWSIWFMISPTATALPNLHSTSKPTTLANVGRVMTACWWTCRTTMALTMLTSLRLPSKVLSIPDASLSNNILVASRGPVGCTSGIQIRFVEDLLRLEYSFTDQSYSPCAMVIWITPSLSMKWPMELPIVWLGAERHVACKVGNREGWERGGPIPWPSTSIDSHIIIVFSHAVLSAGRSKPLLLLLTSQ